ncbi:MAG TPA: redoxin family protein [Rhodothermales bacterium]|nr:redoxin family protein [Rhodothermales bacterium]
MRILYKIAFVLLLCMGLAVSTAQAQEQELPLGTALPMQGQSVQNMNGSSTTIGALTGSAGTVFLFWSNQCLWIDKLKDRVMALHNQFSGQGVNFVLVNANNATAFPQEAASVGQEQGYPMTYVVDSGAAFAKALGASRTPHAFVFDSNHALVYIGTIDDSPGDPGNVKKTYLGDALTAMVGGNAIGVPQTEAFGCTIKF